MNSYVLILGELGAGQTRSGQVQPPNPELGLRGLKIGLRSPVSVICPRVFDLIF